MDAESLKSLGWLLLWGGVFFLMIRYGIYFGLVFAPLYNFFHGKR